MAATVTKWSPLGLNAPVKADSVSGSVARRRPLGTSQRVALEDDGVRKSERQQAMAVGAEERVPQRTGRVTKLTGHRLAGGGVPQPRRSIVGCGGDQPAIGRYVAKRTLPPCRSGGTSISPVTESSTVA